jgi:hypothetical protein
VRASLPSTASDFLRGKAAECQEGMESDSRVDFNVESGRIA